MKRKFNPYWGVRALRARIEKAENRPVLKPRPIWVPPQVEENTPSAYKTDLRRAQAAERRRHQFYKKVRENQKAKVQILRKQELAAAKAVKNGLKTRSLTSAKAALQRAESRLKAATQLRNQVKAAKAFLKAETARKRLLDALRRKRVSSNKELIRKLRSGERPPVDNRWRKAFLAAFSNVPGLEAMVAFVKAA